MQAKRVLESYKKNRRHEQGVHHNLFEEEPPAETSHPMHNVDDFVQVLDPSVGKLGLI